jgi:hypothetical protein
MGRIVQLPKTIKTGWAGSLRGRIGRINKIENLGKIKKKNIRKDSIQFILLILPILPRSDPAHPVLSLLLILWRSDPVLPVLLSWRVVAD